MDSHRLMDTFSRLPFYEISATGELRDWSLAAQGLLGYSQKEMIGRYVTDRAAIAEESIAAAALGLAMRTDQSETFGWAFRKDGTRFWANEVTLAIRDSSAKPTGFARIIRDASLWKAIEDERDRIFRMSVDLICVAGFDGFFKRINPSFTTLLGYSEAELLGKPFVDFVHPDDVAATRDETSALALGAHDSTISFQNRYRCLDGSYRWLEWKSTSDLAEKVIFAVARDVTEQKAIEHKLQESARELERSNGDLQQFAYVASHDLQEPLRAVAGCVQMLGERNAGKLDERSIELMGHAVEGAKRMQTLINDLLAFSRVGSKGIRKELIDPKGAVEKAMKQLSVAIAETNALVIIEPLPHVWADAIHLTQLFQNLIANAIKFRGERQSEIKVSGESQNGETIFSVHDNGIGIAPEYHEKIFGLFQRLLSRRDYAGTGIGLAICRKIVERHGGRIWVESRSGEGADFRFSIPERIQ